MKKSTTEIKSSLVAETLAIGRELGKLLEPGDVVALVGQLGTGKTHFTRGVAEGVGADPDIVTSPTFVLINEYEGAIPLYHFDAYRLSGADDMFALGSDEYFSGNGACLVEWADRVEECLPDEYFRITIEIAGATARSIRFEAFGERYCGLLKLMPNELK
jgi:tRNA threonylcarbamoyladenosine biosynthesis protein TsaE